MEPVRKWPQPILDVLPQSVSKAEAAWIKSRVENHPDLRTIYKKLGAGVLVNLLRYCYQVHTGKKSTPVPDILKRDELARIAGRARRMAKDIRAYSKASSDCSFFVFPAEDEEAAFSQGIKGVLSSNDIAGALDEFADRLEADRKYQSNKERAAKCSGLPISQTIGHIHYRKSPKQGFRPDYREWRLIGEMTNLFRRTYNTPHYGITASLFAATFDRATNEEAISKIVRRMKAQGATPVSIGQ